MPTFMPPLLRISAMLFTTAMLLAVSLLLAGCAPEEKTMLLPQASPSGDQAETEAVARDFTVKKIYTYTYRTLGQLGKSAFLSGCGDNEIHILSLDGEGTDGMLEYRQIDYRYGFHDRMGDFFETWDGWDSPSQGELEEDMYIERLLASPDGKQVLAYFRSVSLDRLTIRLYTLGQAKPLTLYEGTANLPAVCRGSFSPTGRWVTFDACANSTASTRLVPIYDCGQAPSKAEERWAIAQTESRLLAPDRVLYTSKQDDAGSDTVGWPWDAALYDSGDDPGLISLARGSNGSLHVSRDCFAPGESPSPLPSLLDANAEASSYLLHAELLLSNYQETPYPIYRYSEDGCVVRYLSDSSTLCGTDMLRPEAPETVMEFPGLVWDFLPLSGGDILAALVQETREDLSQGAGEELMQSTRNSEQYSQEYCLPAAMQDYWGILSADLYLYPAGSSEGHLLYKSLQNLISLEYDEDTGRILLETYEEMDMARRKCILLEL